MSLQWRLARLRVMSSREIAFRVGRAVRAHVERFGIGLAIAPPPQGASGKAWVDPLPRGFDAAHYTAAADRILAGTFHVFAMSDAQLGFPPQWNRDPKTGTLAPLVFGKSLDYRDPRKVGDIKYLWEINRHLELVTLAQAWHLTRNERYAQGCRTLLDSWMTQCPYPFGVNWCVSLEHAVRLANWSFAWFLLGSDDSVLFRGEEGAAFRQRWLTSVYQHCHFIAGHLSRHSSANNHLLGEATGLFIAAYTWPMWEASARWQTLAREELEREALEQNFPDGVNREQATWYHHAVADMMLLAGLVARANGCDFSASYWQRFQSMLEFITSVMDVSGNVPAIGDADDGVFVRFDPTAELNVYRSLLATGAVLFDRGEFKFKAGAFDAKTRWLVGDTAEAKFAALAANPGTLALPPRRAFPQGGYCVLGGHFETPREVRIVADAGPLGYLSIAAHGHADALSFTLSAAGRPILIDPGTFAYHTERGWRNYFRGTSAHNTVRVDGQDQSVPAGNFLWTQHATAILECFETTPIRDRMVAHHLGYMRLPDPVRHRRTWEYLHASATLIVEDEIECQAEHRLEWFWHFAPGCGVQVEGNRLIARNDGVRLVMTFPPALSCRLETASTDPPLGWYSPGLDRRQPAIAAVMEALARTSTSWRFEVRLEISSASP